MTTQTKVFIDLSRTYTADEFEALPDDGNRYELINGRLQLMPPIGDQHGTITDNLAFFIRIFDPERKLGKVWTNTGFRLNQFFTPEPDLMFIVAHRRPPDSKEALRVIPDLVVEVWSPSQLTKNGIDKDSLDKIRAYQKAGVKIIWSIHPEKQSVSVYHPDQTDPVTILGLNDELDGENVIPGFKLAVSKLFE
jgi:Uma2 family endonuclease